MNFSKREDLCDTALIGEPFTTPLSYESMHQLTSNPNTIRVYYPKQGYTLYDQQDSTLNASTN